MNLEEFRKYVRTVTREEFLSNNANKDDETFQPVDLGVDACPYEYNLPDSSCDISCKECWEKAVKDIKFKDDIEKGLIERMNKQPIIFSDSVNHPSHYTHGKIETIDKIEDVLGLEGFQAYCVGNAIKYLDRYKLKNGFEDIKKAKRYLEFYIEKTEGKEC
ncbi:MAG: DUF3310 domain-containing protein [Clostridium sp.]|uniref:DUF3310 domain-containing protein n=1 Tax=Clostridium sp. TaxID=1506 RepID=UPI0029135021|nr:DUF3310 domain-containing protein [Clostridium sp.]MDU4319768.1 DUF3310 domain-containing protein [Clostridium sp.]